MDEHRRVTAPSAVERRQRCVNEMLLSREADCKAARFLDTKVK